jgi:hypothetical protein
MTESKATVSKYGNGSKYIQRNNTLGSGNIINCRCSNNIIVTNFNLQLYDTPCTVHTLVSFHVGTMKVWGERKYISLIDR